MTPELSRRDLIALGGVSLVLAACGRGRSETTQVTGSTSVAPAATTSGTSASTTPASATTAAAPATTEPSASTSTSVPSPAYVPGDDEGWETIDPADAGWDPVALTAAVDYAFERNTTSFVMTVGGRIMVERHVQGLVYTRDVASVQKSQVSLLVGRAAHDGMLSIDEPVATYLGAGWTNEADERAITITHLLSMTSGLDERLRVVAEPGSTWLYNTNAYQQLHALLEQVTAAPIDQVARDWLWGPIGAATSSFAERRLDDPKGRPLQGLISSARDLCRVGLLVQRGGRWGDTEVYPAPDYIDTALRSSTDFNPSYGLLWWLNGQSGHRLPGPAPRLQPGSLMPSAPPDLVAALGKGDQKIYVSNSLDVVVTRLGDTAEATRAALSGFDDDLWAKLLAAHR